MRRAMGDIPSLLFFRLIEQKNKTQGDIRRINKLFAENFRRIGDIISEYDFTQSVLQNISVR